MKILLKMRKKDNDIKLEMDCFFIYKKQSKITFIIDTGSSFSMISLGDQKKSRISSFGNFTKKAAVGASGGSFNLLEIYGIKIITGNSEKKAETFESETFYLSDGGKKSVLGLNFLKEHNLKLFVDMNEKEAYLERED